MDDLEKAKLTQVFNQFAGLAFPVTEETFVQKGKTGLHYRLVNDQDPVLVAMVEAAQAQDAGLFVQLPIGIGYTFGDDHAKYDIHAQLEKDKDGTFRVSKTFEIKPKS